MFKSDKFIYIQMQKTASTHIAKILSQLFCGQTIGKHNGLDAEQAEQTPYIIASIRNPWDWYVSLWNFGVDGRGALRQSLTQKQGLNLLRNIYQNPQNTSQYCLNFFNKNTQKYQKTYQSKDDIMAFRQWLGLIHNPDNQHDLGEGYGASNISQHIGFMSYRYLYLCCGLTQKTQHSIQNFTDLKLFDAEHCYIDYFVRQENLAATLLAAISKIKTLSKAEKSLISKAGKTNSSSRKYKLEDYYDQKSIDLVAERERLLVEKFNYSPL